MTLGADAPGFFFSCFPVDSFGTAGYRADSSGHAAATGIGGCPLPGSGLLTAG